MRRAMRKAEEKMALLAPSQTKRSVSAASHAVFSAVVKKERAKAARVNVMRPQIRRQIDPRLPSVNGRRKKECAGTLLIACRRHVAAAAERGIIIAQREAADFEFMHAAACRAKGPSPCAHNYQIRGEGGRQRVSKRLQH